MVCWANAAVAALITTRTCATSTSWLLAELSADKGQYWQALQQMRQTPPSELLYNIRILTGN